MLFIPHTAAQSNKGWSLSLTHENDLFSFANNEENYTTGMKVELLTPGLNFKYLPANCEKFLRDHFTVPANTTNPIFRDGYQHVPDTARFTSATNQGLQIIPVFTDPAPHMPLPKFGDTTGTP